MSVPGIANVTAAGAFTYSIPIVIPPGTASEVPSLALNYSSNAGDGLEGVGWFLSGLSAITRCPRTIAQDGIHGSVNYDLNDRYCLNGQRLILKSGTYGAEGSVYGTEIETFSRVTAECDSPGACTSSNGPDWFLVQTRTGKTLQLGKTSSSRIPTSATAGSGSPTIAQWLESQEANSSGSYFNVSYLTTNNYPRPSEIDYTGNGTTQSPYNKVVFGYNGSRVNTYPVYQAGSTSTLADLLTSIKTYAGSNLVSNYVLVYNTPLTTDPAGRYELNSVSRCSDNGGTNCLAPTTFQWQGSKDAIAVGTAIPETFSQGQDMSSGDWNGDGLTDVLLAKGDGTHCLYVGTQSNTFNNSSITATFDDYSSGSSNWVYNQAPCFEQPYQYDVPTSVDFTGDGLTDILITQYQPNGSNPGTWWTNALTNNGTGTLVQSSTNAEFPNGDSILGTGDFTGYGLTDFDTSAGRFRSNAYLSGQAGTFTSVAGGTPTGGFYGDFDGDGCTDTLVSPFGAYFIYYENSTVYPNTCNPAANAFSTGIDNFGNIIVGDFNGDGKEDILSAGNTTTPGLYISTGTGLVLIPSLPSLFFDADYELYGADFNGDGKTDIAAISLVSGTNSTIFLSTGSGFVQANAPNGSPVSISYYGSAVIADWNNDGANDIWIQNDSGDKLYLLNYTPELISSVSTGLCSGSCTTTTISYDRLNHGTIYTKGSGASYPTQDVVNSSYVVSTISTNNAVGGTNSVSYAYTGAKQDLQGRGFLGFSQVKATDSRTGILTTTKFNTLFPLTGTPYEQIVSIGGTTLSDTQLTFTPTNLGSTRTAVNLTESNQVTHNDLHNHAMPTLDTTISYDSYNINPYVTKSTTTLASGTVSSIVTRTQTWNIDLTNWFLSEPLEDYTESNVVGVSDLTRHLDYTTFPATGLIKSAIIEKSTSIELDTDYTYDAFGNIYTVKQSTPVSGDIVARTTTYNFDSKGEFLSSINYPVPTGGVAQTASFTFDTRFGGLTGYTDVNGQTTTIAFDTFGRSTLQLNPDLTGAQISYTYCSGINGGTATCATNGAYFAKSTPVLCNNTNCASPATIGPYTKTTSDLLQRPILLESQGFDGTATSQATVYDGQLHVYRTTRPVFTGNSYAITQYGYDALDRVTSVAFPNNSTTTYTYDRLSTIVAADATGKDQITEVDNNAQGLPATSSDGEGQTTYVYDAFGNPTSINSNGHTITNTFDVRGRKASFIDSDMGSVSHPWTYQYDALSELTQQTDALSQITTIAYDVLGRMTSRNEASGSFISTWRWDTATHGVGKLAEACNATFCGSATYTYTPSYDSLGRVNSETMLINGTSYAYALAYDSKQRLGSVTYPSGFKADYNYNSLSYLSSIVADGPGTAIWTANTADAELHLMQATAGNGVITASNYNANTGNLSTIQVGVSGNPTSIESLSYGWDKIGNLTSREDLHGTNKTESFCYDELNRLTSYGLTTSSSCPVTVSGAVTVAYSAQGNIASKTGIGTYTYGGGGAGSHAVTSITGTVAGVSNPKFVYDANGNMQCMTSGSTCSGTPPRSMSWKPFNMLASLSDTATSNSYALAYDTNHARIRMCSPNCSSATTETDYVNEPITGTMEEAVVSGSSTTWNDYIRASGQIVAMRTHTASTTSWLYFTGDHLRSISIITDSTGAVITGGRQSYDSWGLRRNANWTPATACNAISSATTRGYTQQEELDGGCFVNFNGRVYDPTIGRFISADPYVPNPLDTQSFNRYSYVNNRPLSAIDPSGHVICVISVEGGITTYGYCGDPSVTPQAETGGAATPPRGIPGAPGGQKATNKKPACSSTTLREGQGMIVIGSAGAILGGITSFAGAAVIADPLDGGPANPAADALGVAMIKGGDLFSTASGGLAGAGAVLLAANGQLREGINQLAEFPLTTAADTATPGVGEIVSTGIDTGLNDVEDALHIPQDSCE